MYSALLDRRVADACTLCRTLLEFVVDDDTGNLSGPEVFNVPTWWLLREGFTPRLRIDKGLGPYTYISLDPTSSPKNSLIFDLRRRQFYKFPRFRTQSVCSFPHSELTKRH